MSGFLQKLRIVTLGTANDLLDKAIDMNSPSIVRQSVRDIEDAIGKMNSELAVQEGGLRTLKRQYGDLGNKITADTNAVKDLLAKNPDAARSRAAIVVEEKKQFEQMGNDINSEQGVIDQLSQTSSQLQAKHDLLVTRLRQLERMDIDSKTKESATRAMNTASSILGTSDSISVDDVQDRMQRRNDVASAGFDRAVSSITTSPETNSPEVDDLLASLK